MHYTKNEKSREKNKMTTTKEKKRMTKNEKYLNQMFLMLKKRESSMVADKNRRFNDTELRLMGEILSAKYEGKRLISTQLADLLGITRSAVSQMVNHLEKERVVKRVADAVDRKIAYIEVTDEILTEYEEEFKACARFAGNIVKTFGEEKFQTLYQLFDEFMTVIAQQKLENQ